MTCFPFPMLTARHNGDLYFASLRLADGSVLAGVPGTSIGQAVHHVFQGVIGKSYALPLQQHIDPLADSTAKLCRIFQRLVEIDAELEALLGQRSNQLLRKNDIDPVVHAALAQVQAIVLATVKVTDCLKENAADRNGAAMASHPLTCFAEFMADMAMGWSKLILDQLGLPSAITGHYDVHFDPMPEDTFSAFTPGWPTEQTDQWWRDRERRQRHYRVMLASVMEDAPQRSQRIKDKVAAIWPEMV